MVRRLFLLLFTLFVARAAAAAAAVADMKILKLGPASPAVNPGAFVDYALNIQSNGPGPASNITVTDVLPPGTSLVSTDTSFAFGFTCSGTGTVVCTFPGPFPTGGQSSITLRVTAPTTPGPFTNTATVSATESDPNSANNTASLTLTVVTPGTSADLFLQKRGPTLPVPTSSLIVYDLAIINNGPATEPAPTLTDALPPGTTFVSASPVIGPVSCSGTSTIVCNFGPILPFGSGEVTLTVTAPPTADRSQTTQASPELCWI